MKISVDRESGRSLTDQIVDELRAAVRSGRWKAGERLPTREELMAMCGVSRNVVQTAIRRLVAEGLVVTRPRLGCIVTRPSRRPIRGVVLEVDTGCGIPYWNALFSDSLRRALSAERIDCRNVGLSYDGNDRMRSFDRDRLERELSQRPDMVLAVSSLSRTAELQRLLDAHDTPYMVSGRPAPGRHPQMLWACANDVRVRMDGFVADCIRARVRSVTWLAYSGKSGFDPRAELEKAGIAVETVLANRKAPSCDVGLGQYVELARDCMLERLEKGRLCDLLFVADDYLAMGAVPALLERGVRIPDDVKLVTQYNKGFGLALSKSIARIEVDPEGFAAECARSIAEWLKTDRFPDPDVPAPVYVRGETFPVPGADGG